MPCYKLLKHVNDNFDIAIIGSGFAGSLLAMIARRLGRSVVLIERGRHPRFAIGESSTPLANLLLEELARRYDLPAIAPLSKWGSWQRTYPRIGCGLKRGFTFYHHEFGKPFTDGPEHLNQLLVGASPNNEIGDTHWYRPDFDELFVQQAQSLGVDYRDEVNLTGADVSSDAVTLRAPDLTIKARFVVDASGPRGFLHRVLNLAEKPFEHLPATQSLFSHFTGVRRLDGMDITPDQESPPYPIDDAAVHHVFDGGWIWVLRFNNGVTSAGVAATDKLANELRFAESAPAWTRLLERLPTVRQQFADSNAILPFVHIPRLSFRCSEVVGERWAMLPSAAGFVDPLLSTGFPLTLLGVARMGEAMEHNWESGRLQTYARQTKVELAAAERLIAALYANMTNFPRFVALSLLYFTAASYAETARRRGRSELVQSFLLCDDPQFGLALRRCCEMSESHSDLIDEVFRVIKPFDVAGLSDRTRRNWFPFAAPL